MIKSFVPQGTSSINYIVRNIHLFTPIPDRLPKFMIGDIVYEVNTGVFAYKVQKILASNTEYEYCLSPIITEWSHNPYVSLTKKSESVLVPAYAIEIPGREIKDKDSYMYQIDLLMKLIKSGLVK